MNNEFKILKIKNELVKVQKILQEKEKQLENKNIALNELVNLMYSEKQQVKDVISKNLDKLIIPYIHELYLKAPEDCKIKLEQIEIRLKNITNDSLFDNKIFDLKNKLSPKEIQICNLLKDGYDSGQIANELNISEKTVYTHRNNIRIKLKIKNKRINLYSYLFNI